jgi:hypothetical protein
MKKMMKWTAVSVLAAAIMVPSLASAAEMKMMVDYTKVAVVMKDGQSLVPLRQVAESLGYQVSWTKSAIVLTKNVMVSSKESTMKDMKDMSDMNEMKAAPYKVSIMLGSKNVWVGMDKKMLTYAPVTIKNTAYVTKECMDMYIANPMMDMTMTMTEKM